jgi:hypothetical protein
MASAKPSDPGSGPNVSVSANGDQRVQKGTATSTADGTGSVAISRVHGDNSQATACDGDNNTATVTGDGLTAIAGPGQGNTVIVP